MEAQNENGRRRVKIGGGDVHEERNQTTGMPPLLAYRITSYHTSRNMSIDAGAPLPPPLGSPLLPGRLAVIVVAAAAAAIASPVEGR